MPGKTTEKKAVITKKTFIQLIARVSTAYDYAIQGQKKDCCRILGELDKILKDALNKFY